MQSQKLQTHISTAWQMRYLASFSSCHCFHLKANINSVHCSSVMQSWLFILSQYYYDYTHLTTSFPGQSGWVSRYQKGKTSLDLNDAIDDGVFGCTGISWAICKQSAPRCRQITTPTPYQSIFYRSDALPDARPTVSKHWSHRHCSFIVKVSCTCWSYMCFSSSEIKGRCVCTAYYQGFE